MSDREKQKSAAFAQGGEGRHRGEAPLRPSSDGESCLRVERLSKTFERRTGGRTETIRAVDDVSLQLGAGETLGIIGTSGCGKTTLLNIILGLIAPDSGTVDRQGPVGVVGQDPYASLCPAMTVERIVAEPLIFLHRRRSFADCLPQVRQAMKAVRLPYETFARRLPAQLSGGERQRVGIARALIVRPRILLMDEPTSMLDQEVKEEIASVIREVRASGFALDGRAQPASLLMVTHDVQLAAQLCDRILVMDQGRIIEENTAQGLLNAPQSPLAQDLVRISTDVGAYWKEKYGV